MSFVSISDVHIKSKDDEAQRFFLQFLQHPKTQAAQKIYLLGDIFDLIVGPKIEWLFKFHTVFFELSKLVKQGKEIHFIEGNHDFHVERVFQYLKEVYNLPEGRVHYYRDPFVSREFGKKILFCHGDEIELGNWSYKIYRFLIKSRFIKALSYIVPYVFIKWIGTNASSSSRKRNNQKYTSENQNEKIKINVIKSSKKASRDYRSNVVICGHGHVLENYRGKRLHYLNNGYFPQTRSFVHGTSQDISLIQL